MEMEEKVVNEENENEENKQDGRMVRKKSLIMQRTTKHKTAQRKDNRMNTTKCIQTYDVLVPTRLT
jgi:hypothetical protein